MAVTELLNHGAVLKGFNVIVGKELEIQANCLGGTAGVNECCKTVVTYVDVGKFVDMGNPDPISILYDVLALRVFKRFHLIVAPLCRVGQMRYMIQTCQSIQQSISAVIAIVGVEQKVRHPDALMKSDPFQ